MKACVVHRLRSMFGSFFVCAQTDVGFAVRVSPDLAERTTTRLTDLVRMRLLATPLHPRLAVVKVGE